MVGPLKQYEMLKHLGPLKLLRCLSTQDHLSTRGAQAVGELA